jgi:hypothetical protein
MVSIEEDIARRVHEEAEHCEWHSHRERALQAELNETLRALNRQAENELLLIKECAAARAEGEARLDPQIARADKQHLRAIELDAKLTALREAAKIFIDSDWDGEAVGTFAAAIEANK